MPRGPTMEVAPDADCRNRRWRGADHPSPPAGADNAMHDAADLAQSLARRAPELAIELLPEGRRDGREWRAGSVAGEPGNSLGFCIYGAKAGTWKDFAGEGGGDALDLVAAVLFGGDIKRAMDWSRSWLGLTNAERVGQEEALRRAREEAAHRVDEEQEQRRRKALGLFLSSREGLNGTPVAAYLAGRGIDLSELGRTPRALRFHPGVWCQEARARLPAMLAAITNGRGEHVATHRTWLTRKADGRWVKAPLQDTKKTLGSYAGGFIPLQRGASGRPLRTAPEGERLAIAEGIETALSVAIACPDLRVVAGVSLSNLARIKLPAAVQTIVLCADNDRAENRTALRALVAAIHHFANEGRTVRLARPTAGKDFNDMLRAKLS